MTSPERLKFSITKKSRHEERYPHILSLSLPYHEKEYKQQIVSLIAELRYLQRSIMKSLIRYQEMKYYFTAFCLLLASLLPIEAQTIRQIEVSFPILKGKMKLQGVVSQVAEAPQQSPILVLVTPPQASNRDYVGFFKALSDSLNRKGYTTFRYDNRSYSDTLQGNQLHEGRYTMHDAADDLHDALAFLKSDERFASHPVGVIGHSEGGSVAIIEASDFLPLHGM